MTEQGYPFDGQTTDELMWRRLMRWIMASGVLRGEDNALLVGPRGGGANMSVDVATGQAFAVGHYYRNDAIVSLAIGNNATGNPRIDTVVVGWDFAANTSSVYVLPGVTAAAPAPTALTQDLAAKWEIPLAYVYVAAGESTSIDAGEIADARQWAGPVAHAPQVPVVRLATTVALAASTITGINRVANANGALGNIDSTAPAVGDDVLDKDHATGAARGPWRIVDLGSATKPWRMVRSPIADTSAKVRSGLWVRVTEGTLNGDKAWMLTTDDPIVLGTTALTFTQFPAAVTSSILNATYYTGGSGNYSTTSTVSVPIDSTNLRSIATVPASGKVIHRLELDWDLSVVAAGYVYLGVVDAAGVSKGDKTACFVGAGMNSFVRLRVEILETGLTPGASITRDLAWRVTSGQTMRGYKGTSSIPTIITEAA